MATAILSQTNTCLSFTYKMVNFADLITSSVYHQIIIDSLHYCIKQKNPD